MTENKKKLFEILENSNYGLMPAPMSADFAIGILCDYLLGDDFYITDPVSQEQANTLIVYNILKYYSKEFRRDFRGRIKECQKRNTAGLQ